ncbi:MAG: YihY/virulence factor BrkB family protein, partial [Muribaculaceae bacterium]|nr:YihY/virulence factor BrkB family protein [Muribaculaceae bacterium]
MAKPETPGRKAPEKPAARKLPLVDQATALYDYVSAGVWSDTRSGWKVNTVKTVNLSVRSFFNSDLQNRACGLTYQTLLAIVPALALLFAIARGFGFQNLVQSQLLTSFPAQRKALETALSFVDSYLATSSEGIFVGVGIVFLLWTLISLLPNVEDAFNQIWGV